MMAFLTIVKGSLDKSLAIWSPVWAAYMLILNIFALNQDRWRNQESVMLPAYSTVSIYSDIFTNYKWFIGPILLHIFSILISVTIRQYQAQY